MLKLVGITKDYISKDQPIVHALNGININFRRCEFVAILGHSGCGKTTLLNIIGGLDRYTDGDLIIEGVSTKDYKDRDWDTYRNHSIGFVFQSYNLIPHINILKNVEIALTISGVSKAERKNRAMEALKKVGLEGLEKKKPNQLSGGQMQRVAIARALVNNPEILLADEPTGALDSDTSIQIMNLLKEVSNDRLVIMVTHNPELAKQYANRIVKMKDGLLVDDSNPYKGESAQEREKHKESAPTVNKGNKKRTSMSFFTAVGLSANNLMTKKGRSFLMSFAGSIGIIGIALILSVSFGFNEYIGRIQTDALSSYPMTVNKETVDVAALVSSVMGQNHDGEDKYPNTNIVQNDSTYTNMIASMVSSKTKNDTKAFKEFIERPDVKEKYIDDIIGVKYSYNVGLNIYSVPSDGENTRRIYPIDFTYGDYSPFEQSFVNKINEEIVEPYMNLTGLKVFEEMIPNYNYELYPDQNYNEILTEQYDLLYGEMPKEMNEVVIIVNEYNCIDDYLLYGLGLKSPQYLMETIINNSMPGAISDPIEDEPFEMSFEELCNLSFYLPMAYDIYEKNEGNDTFSIKTGSELTSTIENSPDTLKLDVVGIIRGKKGVTNTSLSGAVGYLPSLTEYIINQSNRTDIPDHDTVDNNVIIAQKANTTTDVITGASLSDTSYEDVLKNLGCADLSDPDTIYIYPKAFSSKSNINKMVEQFNIENGEKLKEDYIASHPDYTEEELQEYIDNNELRITDTVGTLMSSVQIIVDSVTYVLIAFVSISLVVSSIMIGVITYVSVLERTKEIGILRAMGARKLDVANVFNAETFIIGLTAGIIGVVAALIIDIPLAIIINSLAGVSLNIVVPWYGIVILPIISFILTLISGLIPASIASKKDPAVSLRSE